MSSSPKSKQSNSQEAQQFVDETSSTSTSQQKSHNSFEVVSNEGSKAISKLIQNHKEFPPLRLTSIEKKFCQDVAKIASNFEAVAKYANQSEGQLKKSVNWEIQNQLKEFKQDIKKIGEESLEEVKQLKSKEFLAEVDKHKSLAEGTLEKSTKELTSLSEEIKKKNAEELEKFKKESEATRKSVDLLLEKTKNINDDYDKNCQLVSKKFQDDYNTLNEKLKQISTDGEKALQTMRTNCETALDEKQKLMKKELDDTLNQTQKGFNAELDKKVKEAHDSCKKLTEGLNGTLVSVEQKIQEAKQISIDTTKSLNSFSETYLNEMKTKLKDEMEKLYKTQVAEVKKQIEEMNKTKKNVESSLDSVSEGAKQSLEKFETTIQSTIKEKQKIAEDFLKKIDSETTIKCSDLRSKFDEASKKANDVSKSFDEKIKIADGFTNTLRDLNDEAHKQETLLEERMKNIQRAKEAAETSKQDLDEKQKEVIKAKEAAETAKQDLVNKQHEAIRKVNKAKEDAEKAEQDLVNKQKKAEQSLLETIGRAEQLNNTMSTVNPYTIFTYALFVVAVVLHLFLQYFKRDLFE